MNLTVTPFLFDSFTNPKKVVCLFSSISLDDWGISSFNFIKIESVVIIGIES